MNYKTLYEENQEFKDYVDRYCAEYSISVKDALTHAIVQEVGDMYESR